MFYLLGVFCLIMKLQHTSRQSSGVSSVLAVILLIAVTVAIVAVMSEELFVFTDILEDQEQNPTGSVRFYESYDEEAGSYEVEVQLIRKVNVEYVRVETVLANAQYRSSYGEDYDGDGYQNEVVEVGGSVFVSGLEPGDEILVTAYSEDGKTQVLNQKEIAANSE